MKIMTQSPLDQYNSEDLDNFISLFNENDLLEYAAYDLVLLLTEVRPGIHIYLSYNDYRYLDEHPLQQLLESLNLPYQLIIQNNRLYRDQTGATAPNLPGREEQSLDTREVEYDHQGIVTYHVARNPKRLITHSPEIEATFPHFLNYPKPDIKAFESNEYSMLDTIPFEKQLYNGDISLKNLLYAALPRYFPAHTRDGIQRAVERGKKYYEACQHFDDHCDTTVATDYAHNSMNNLRKNLDEPE